MRRQLRAALASRDALVAAITARWAIGLRAALSVGLPLVLGVIIGRPSWGALASIGGFAGFYGNEAPYRHRLKLAAAVGATLTIVVPIGSLCASHAVLAVAFVAVVAAIASFVCLALAVPPPREYLIVLAALAATGIPADAATAGRECWLVATGAATGVIVALSPVARRGRPTPQSRALTRAWDAVAGLLAAAGTPVGRKRQPDAVAAVRTAREAVRQTGAAGTGRELASLAAVEVVLASALSTAIDATEPLDSSAVEAVSALARLSVDPSGPPPPPVATPGLDHAIDAAHRLLLGPAGDATAPDRPPARERLSEALSSRHVVLPTAARVAVTVAAGAAVGRVLGLDHSYWVGLTAAAALQANQVTLLVRRALHRLTGTIVGVGLVGLVFALSPARAVVAGMALVAQGIAETLIRASYAIAIVFVTVIALSIYDLAVPNAGLAAAVGARAIDTAIGAALVISLRLVLWPRVHEARLPRAKAETVRVSAQLLRERWRGTGQAQLAPIQRELQERLLELRTLAENARGDRIRVRGDSDQDRTTEAVEELAMLALGVPHERPAPSPAAAEVLTDELVRIAERLGGDESGSIPATPALRGYPRTQAAAELLRASVTATDEFSPSARSFGANSPHPISGGQS